LSERREIKSYVIRGGRMNEGRRRALEGLYDHYGLRFSYEAIQCESLHPEGQSAAKVIVEIGFGTGEALIDSAARNPRNLYIGIEVFPAGVATVLREIHEREIRNVRVIMHDAVEAVRYMLPDDSIDGFHVFFPDPWPKKKHHKRRLLSRSFVSLLCRRLKPGGYLYVVTDWDSYATQILDACNAEGTMVPAAAPLEGRPETKYEKKGIALSHEIHEIAYIKTSASA